MELGTTIPEKPNCLTNDNAVLPILQDLFLNSAWYYRYGLSTSFEVLILQYARGKQYYYVFDVKYGRRFVHLTLKANHNLPSVSARFQAVQVNITFEEM